MLWVKLLQFIQQWGEAGSGFMDGIQDVAGGRVGWHRIQSVVDRLHVKATSTRHHRQWR